MKRSKSAYTFHLKESSFREYIKTDIEQWLYRRNNIMKVKVTWEFDADVEDFDPEFIDIKGLAEDSAKRELQYLIKHEKLSADDFNYEVENEKENQTVSFEIEHYNGDTYMAFEVNVTDDKNINVIKTQNCSHADTDGDYIFGTENDLIRIQADKPISKDEYDNILDCYRENEIDTDIEVKLKELLEEQSTEYGCSVEEVKNIMLQEWGKGADRGYRIATEPDMEQGLTVIERIDEYGVYDSDLEAGLQAEKDGVQLIPFEENPKEYPYDCYRILDTKVNRQIIKKIKEMEK